MVDTLFEIASQPRTPWHPESHTQETACECLVALFSFPTETVPGLPFKYSDVLQDKATKEEWEHTLRALEILASRQGYREGIIRVFKILDEEELESVLQWVDALDPLLADDVDMENRLTDRIAQDYYAEVSPHNNEIVKQIWFDRGESDRATSF